MMSANVSVCYEPDSCVFTDIVLVDVRFPKPNCNYKSSDYNMPGIFIYIYSCYSIWRTVVLVDLFSWNSFFNKKSLCYWAIWSIFSGFSLTSWSLDQSLSGGTLPTYAARKLMKDLGIAMYMNETACSPGMGAYTGLVDGWNKGQLIEHLDNQLRHVLKIVWKWSENS